MILDSLRKQTLAASLSPTRETGTATLRFHARTKTMLALAGSFRCLIGAFHLPIVKWDGKGRNHTAVVNDSSREQAAARATSEIRRLTQTSLQCLALRVYSPKP